MLQPEYDYLFDNNGFWQLEKEGCVGLYTSDMRCLSPDDNIQTIVSDGIIEVFHAEHTARQYDFEGNLVVDFVIDEISNMRFATDKLTENASDDYDSYGNDYVYGVANRMLCRVSSEYNDFYGLISRDGRRITPPLYTSIEAIAGNFYRCQSQGIVIDDDGNMVN